MVHALITYLPYSRLFETKKYFLENVSRLNPSQALIYVDDVFTEDQLYFIARSIPEGITVRHGFWGNRSACFLQILMDLKTDNTSDALIVDSDNILDQEFTEVDQRMLSKGFDFYTVKDWEGSNTQFNKRSVKLGEIEINGGKRDVYGYRLTGFWKSPFFLGPKQAVRVTKKFLEKLDTQVTRDVYDAVQSMDPLLRNMVCDETPIAITFYYSGVKITPWVICSRHFYNQARNILSRANTRRLMKSTAYVEFTKKLVKWKYKRMIWFYLRYKIAQLGRSVPVLLGDL
jgi:hypothetical protein